MVSITTIVRKTPPRALENYFVSKQVPLTDFAWNDAGKNIAKPLLAAIEGLDPDLHARVGNDLERVGAMADEAGQAAIFGVTADTSVIDGLGNGYERAMWLFLHRPEQFRRAEEVRYTDDRRRGKHWDGFVGDPEAALRRDDASIAAFVMAIRERFGSKNVHVDIFDRHRSTFEGKEYALIQATVYSEDRLQDYLEFVDGTLDLKGRHPVIEASLTYEPDTGVIEAVAGDRKQREEYVRLFARDLLGIEFDDERLPFREYVLNSLLKRHEFLTDPADGIEVAYRHGQRARNAGMSSRRQAHYLGGRGVPFRRYQPPGHRMVGHSSAPHHSISSGRGWISWEGSATDDHDAARMRLEGSNRSRASNRREISQSVGLG